MTDFGCGSAAGLLLCCSRGAAALPAPPTPSEPYPGLFERVQMERVYEDGKTFVDALPRKPPVEIMKEYEASRDAPGFELGAFVRAHFDAPVTAAAEFRSSPGMDVEDHIDALWPVLERQPDVPTPHSSLLPLPHRYVVPGGRFREIYYWDSYFTMLGLEESGRHDLALDMVKNFAFLIDRYGHVPNGNRTYYLSRSQPPFFAAMVELIAARDGSTAYLQFLPALRREYEFWMDGASTLERGAAHRRAVRLRDGSILNRYWDDRETAREESYREDVADRGKFRPPAGRGVPEPARGSRKRMGLQLSLVRRRADARHDPHGRHHSRRSQLPPLSARADARARLPRQRTAGGGHPSSPSAQRTGDEPSTGISGISRRACSRTTPGPSGASRDN